MKINLYYNSSEKNKIGKSLTRKLSLTGTLKEECSITKPIIIIESESLFDVNYAYVEEFNRYYFISDITSVKYNLWRVYLNCDVLESFKDKILNLNCIIDKQSSIRKSNSLFDDGSYVNEIDTFNEIAKFQRGFNESGEFILLTAGAIDG